MRSAINGLLLGLGIGLALSPVFGVIGWAGSSLINGCLDPFSVWRSYTGMSMYGFSAAGVVIGAVMGYNRN